MIRIGVCDDNIATLEKLYGIINRTFLDCLANFKVTKYSNGTTLLNAHRNYPFDVIFLDIDMPELTGFDVAKMLRNDFSTCFIIFVTNHSELVYESMDFQPFQFIRKKLSMSLEESVSIVVKKLMKHMKQNEKVILEDDNFGRHAVDICDIIYIESNKHYINYYVLNLPLPIKMRGSINEYEEKYSDYNFVRIHRQYLINLKYLSDLNYHNEEIALGIIDKKLPMSKKFKKDVDEKYTLYLRSMV